MRKLIDCLHLNGFILPGAVKALPESNMRITCTAVKTFSSKNGLCRTILTIISVLLVSLPSGLTAEPKTASPPTPQANLDLDSAGNPYRFKLEKGHPEKGRLTFTATIGKFHQIMVVDLKSRKFTALIEGNHNNSYPTWSPDGRQLSFVSDRNGNNEIYVADWNGDNQRRLTNNLLDDNYPTWIDQNTIGFTTSEGTGATENVNIFQVEAAGGTLRQVSNLTGRNIVPRWSPDKSKVAYTTNRFWPGWDVCILDLKNRQETCPLSGPDSFCRSAWSSDGKSLLYSSGVGEHIYIGQIKLEDASTQALSDPDHKAYDVAATFDPNLLIYVSDAIKANNYDVYLYDLQAKKSRPLVTSIYPLRYPSWTSANTLELEAQRLKSLDPNKGVVKPEKTVPTSKGAAPNK